MKKKQLRPRDCRNLDEVCKLRTDHHDIKGAWILFDGYTLSMKKQNMGEVPTEEIHFTRADFNRLVDWWNRPQTVRVAKGDSGEHANKS